MLAPQLPAIRLSSLFLLSSSIFRWVEHRHLLNHIKSCAKDWACEGECLPQHWGRWEFLCCHSVQPGPLSQLTPSLGPLHLLQKQMERRCPVQGSGRQPRSLNLFQGAPWSPDVSHRLKEASVQDSLSNVAPRGGSSFLLHDA